MDKKIIQSAIAALELLYFGDVVKVMDPTKIQYNDETIDNELRKISRSMAALDRENWTITRIMRGERKIVSTKYLEIYKIVAVDESVSGNSRNLQTERRLESEGFYDDLWLTQDILKRIFDAKDTLTRVEMNFKKIRGSGPDFGTRPRAQAPEDFRGPLPSEESA